MIPYRYLILSLGAIVLIGGMAYKCYSAGQESVQAKWDADKAKQIVQAEITRVAHQEAIDGYAKQLAIKSIKAREITVSNASKVDKYAPRTFPALPGSFRLYHDAAATGEALDDSRGIAAAEVSLTDTAATINYNYAACRYDQERLEALQDIVRTMNGGGDGKETE